MSVLPLHLPTYSKNRHFSFFSMNLSLIKILRKHWTLDLNDHNDLNDLNHLNHLNDLSWFPFVRAYLRSFSGHFQLRNELRWELFPRQANTTFRCAIIFGVLCQLFSWFQFQTLGKMSPVTLVTPITLAPLFTFLKV